MGTRLAIDPGLNCGWSLWAVDEPTLLYSGVQCLRNAYSPAGFRFAFTDMYNFMRDMLRDHEVAQVAYEKVRFHRGVDAAHMYGGLEAVIHMVCAEFDVQVIPVEISTWKQSIGAKGTAPHYDAVVRKMYPTVKASRTGDEAAATGIGHCAFVVQNVPLYVPSPRKGFQKCSA